MIAFIADTETTGLDHTSHEIIELAYKPFDSSDPPVVERFHPSKPIDLGALSTHHILDEELEAEPPSSLAFSRLPPCDYLIGHNIDFDWNFLGQPNCRRICTQAMARELWPEIDSHRLVALMYHTKGRTKETRTLVHGAHSAGDDVLMCEQLLRTIMFVAKIEDLETLYLFSEEARIPKVMAFGKFRGQAISAVDRGYSNWYRRQPDPDLYLLEAFRRNGLL